MRISSFLSVAAASICLLALPALASASTATPLLTSTTPASPGTSTEPRIRGNADGVITSVVAPRRGPLARAIEPSATINLFTDPACTGSTVATGTAEDLEGAGIPVKVAPDSEATFYANETGIGGTSGCSNGITYRQVSSAPAAPVLSGVTPASPANDNHPHLHGTVDKGAIVFIHESPSCNDAPTASGSAAEFEGEGIEAQVPDNSTTTFFAQATLAGIPSGCSLTSVTYQEATPSGGGGESGGGSSGGGGSGGGGSAGGGTTAPPPSNGTAKPPAPRLRTLPGGIANNADPIVVGSAPEAVKVLLFASADCSGGALWSGSPADLAAGLPVSMSPNTTMVLSARSVDSDGDRSVCSDPVGYTDDSIAPRTRITVGPGIKTLRHTVVFRFTDSTGGPDTHFLCKLDKKHWKECSAPLRLKHLGHRRHILKVKAYDAAGNREKRPVARSFQVIR